MLPGSGRVCADRSAPAICQSPRGLTSSPGAKRMEPCKSRRDPCLRNAGVAITISTDSGQWLIIRVPLARDRRNQKLCLRVRRG